MKYIDLVDIQKISGGVLDSDMFGLRWTKTVPDTGIPSKYYNLLDWTFNETINFRMSESQYKMEISSVPDIYKNKYAENMNLVRWTRS